MIRRILVVVGVVAAAAALLALVATGSSAAVAWHRVGRLDVTPTGHDPSVTTVLLVGVDSRTPALADPQGAALFPDRRSLSGERADAIVLLRTDASGTHALAVPRDLLVAAPGNRTMRLTLTWEQSPEQLVSALCSIGPGIGVDHVVAVDYRALVDLVDAVGGMTVTTEYPVRDRQAHLAVTGPGTVTLDGAQALAWIRARHLERQTAGGWTPVPPIAQRSMLAAEALSAVSSEALARAPWLVAALPSVAPAVRVDLGFSMTDALALARSVPGRSALEELPARLTPGEIPVAEVTEQTRQVLAGFVGDETCGPR